MTARGTLEMIAAMTISGTIGWFVVIAGQPALDVVFWRCVFGAASLLLVCASLGLLRRLPGIRILAAAALGGVAIVLNWVLLFLAFPKASISIATAVYSMQPFMLVGLGALLFGEPLTRVKLAWLALAFAGVLLIVEGKPGTGSDYLAGILLALGAAFCYAVAAAFTKKLAGTPPHLLALVQLGVGAAMLAPFANLAAPPREPGTWGVLATIGVVHTGLMFTLLYGALQKLPTHLVASLSFIYPVVAVATDYLAFDQRLHALQLSGAAAILVATAGMQLGWSWRGRDRGQRR